MGEEDKAGEARVELSRAPAKSEQRREDDWGVKGRKEEGGKSCSDVRGTDNMR